MRTRLRQLVVLAIAVLTLTGCGLTKGVYELPLPGGADVGDDPLTLTVEFADVLDLVPNSSVKLDSVDVGRVTHVELADDGEAAVVTLKVRRGLGLEADASARLQQTTLLGEKYVALVRGTATEEIADGARIGREATARAVGVEEVLGALSMLLNGGGVEQFQSIYRELKAIGGGRTGEIRLFLKDMETFVKGFDGSREAISDAIDGMAELSTQLADNRSTVERVLEDLSPGVQELAAQREDLVSMMTALDRLSRVTGRTLRAAGDDIEADFRLLAPVLEKLAEGGKALPNSLGLMLTFPFTDRSVRAVKGDYVNAFIKMKVHGGSPLPRAPFMLESSSPAEVR